jgi:hypothetical protein
MRSRATICLLAGLVVAPSGCASAANVFWWTPVEGGQRVFGGVRAHVESLRRTFRKTLLPAVGPSGGMAGPLRAA